ncbi:PLP-dependent aminotransferase family protein [Nocardia sp. alder85J]|uniref:MocR-like pyridoxine biosynthesis transcription factor PdxR n=1 Tax=Nocardia sp. alder85J TaxID=2862949 RepID=UPI001CD781E9|nr:PLP-dependent aminotransferase family protein [Nocardia sp. alder85J]MCX4098655.1 PLP-dependent aminotransferase family protein [Nocardia sp. alder85J]
MSGRPPGPELLLELTAHGTRRHALEEALRGAIRDGRLRAGSGLPSSRDLAAQLGLSRGTVTTVFEQLVAEGWLTARQGAGTRVAAGVVAADHEAATPAPAEGTYRFDLRPGRPDVGAFPRNAWTRAMRVALREAPADAFGFGDPRGRLELRTTLAAYLGRVRGMRVDPAQVVICSGYTQALGLLADVFAELGVGTVGMEDPSIGDHARLVATRLTVADIPVDDNGIRVDALIGSGAGAVVCTPAHQFPTGVAMTPQRRTALLDWADDRGGWIVEDDYDGEFRYDRHPTAALHPRGPARVIYAGSTSKTIGPAVRLGWIVCPPGLLDRLVAAKRRTHDWRTLDQLALARLIDTGAYDRHLRTARRGYRRRRDLLTAAVRNDLPHSVIRGLEAGLHAVLELPPGTTEAAARTALAAASVTTFGLTDLLRTDRHHYPPSLVLGYATPSARDYPTAVDTLTRTLAGLGR